MYICSTVLKDTYYSQGTLLPKRQILMYKAELLPAKGLNTRMCGQRLMKVAIHHTELLYMWLSYSSLTHTFL